DSGGSRRKPPTDDWASHQRDAPEDDELEKVEDEEGEPEEELEEGEVEIGEEGGGEGGEEGGGEGTRHSAVRRISGRDYHSQYAVKTDLAPDQHWAATRLAHSPNRPLFSWTLTPGGGRTGETRRGSSRDGAADSSLGDREDSHPKRRQGKTNKSRRSGKGRKRKREWKGG
ncbi:unnamed protein product, partial [Darwinula stevensoni]